MTALKLKKLRALFHVSGGGSNGNWRDLSSYLLESIRVQADVRQELFDLLCKTIKTANDPSEVNSQICIQGDHSGCFKPPVDIKTKVSL